MKRDNDRQTAIILSIVGIVPVIWLALLIAPSISGGLPEIAANLPTLFDNPFSIKLCGDSLKTVLILLLCYGMGIGIYFSTRKNYRRREEHGSAKWGNVRAIDKKYRQKPLSENKLMTQNVCIGLNAKKHRRNLNTLVCGGSGAGKTRFYAKPNIMNAARNSYVILDPKGEILRDTGHLLEKKGYEVRVLDLISMEKSHCYNPFVYLQNDNDVQKLVTNLFKSTTPKGSQSNDPFWDTAASMLLLALVFYLHYEAPPEEQNFAMVMEMLRAGAIEDEDDPSPSPLDNLFSDLMIDKDDDIIGHNHDGSFNEDYCKWCYADGTYTYNDMDDLIEVCVKNMVSENFTEEQARSYMKELLPTLDYWKKYDELSDNGQFEEFKKKLINEINELNVDGMPKVEKLNALVGKYVNLEYQFPNGKALKFLNDAKTYLGNQLECEYGGDRCFGVVADMDFILICTYEEDGKNPELVLYKKR